MYEDTEELFENTWVDEREEGAIFHMSEYLRQRHIIEDEDGEEEFLREY